MNASKTIKAETEFEKAFETMFNIFAKYAGECGDGKSDELEKSEMESLINTELVNFVEHVGSLDKVFDEVDADRSGSLTFKEFMIMLADIADRSKMIEEIMKKN